MILVVAIIGTASTAPVTPNSQSQKNSAMITSAGFSVNRRASSIGVGVSPSTAWISR
jgi:hypothetical protein